MAVENIRGLRISKIGSNKVRTTPMSDLPLVKIVATGGTIANTPSGRLHAAEVAEAIPELKTAARIDIEEVCRVGSSDITPDRWLLIARRINELAADPEIAGFVV